MNIVLDNRTKKTAEKFKIYDKVIKLKRNILQLQYAKSVIFDLDEFYDNLNQVIFVVGYDIDVRFKNYFEIRKNFIEKIIEVAKQAGLTRTQDQIEDYGAHFYFVFKCNNDWNS